MLRYIEDKKKDEYELLKLQDKILEIVDYFDKFCKDNGITYFLMGGSALGAMRHGGYIPWDDDFDVFMDYENYIKFLGLSDNMDKSKFYFQRQNTAELPYYFSKIRMNGTTFLDDVTKKDMDKHYGIFIDIMCLYNVPNCKILQKLQYYEAALLKARAVIDNGYYTDSKLKKVQLFIAKVVVNKLTKKVLYKCVSRYSKDSTPLVGHFFGRAKFNNSIYKKEWFKEQRFVAFEKMQLPVPCGVEEYLQTRYGNKYMELPDQKTRAIYQQHASFWDVDNDYSKYVKDGVKSSEKV